MTYREPLPAECPPETAEEIILGREVFRIVMAEPPTLDDFRSQRAEKPNAVFKNVSECLARGVSVFADRSDCETVLKLPRLRGRKLACVRLAEGAGKILQTFEPSHHTWWPFANFDILANCEVEQV
jgi:hypothetical protein